MQEKQLINKLKELQQIKPRKDWVILAKNQILESNSIIQAPVIKRAQKSQVFEILGFLPALIYRKKLAYAFATILFIVMVGIFGFAQQTVPGDILFSVKKMTEQSQIALSQENQLKNNLETANRRLDDLTQVVKNNKMQNIPPAIKEFQVSISQVTKDLINGINQKDSQSIKNIALQIKKIEDNKKELQTYGVDLGATQESKDLNDALAPLVQREIDALEKTTLTDDQQKIVQTVKDLYADGKYSDALEGILTLNK